VPIGQVVLVGSDVERSSFASSIGDGMLGIDVLTLPVGAMVYPALALPGRNRKRVERFPSTRLDPPLQIKGSIPVRLMPASRLPVGRKSRQ
jgi:hypothetical protein